MVLAVRHYVSSDIRKHPAGLSQSGEPLRPAPRPSEWQTPGRSAWRPTTVDLPRLIFGCPVKEEESDFRFELDQPLEAVTLLPPQFGSKPWHRPDSQEQNNFSPGGKISGLVLGSPAERMGNAAITEW
jgi:hypothetical protein